MSGAVTQERRGEHGFSLIELLVVILIIGILAAIAIPSFLSQRSKAQDTAAKVQARTMETAMESAASDQEGEYKGVELKRLEAIEATLSDHTQAKPEVVKAEAKEYEVKSTEVSTGDEFTIHRDTEGKVTRTCRPPGAGACPQSGSW